MRASNWMRGARRALASDAVLSLMNLLVLGGTAFVGRRIVEAAIARGHDVTIFTRGRTNPGIFPEVEHLRGDREVDLSPLDGRRFDAAIDTSGYLPRVVRASAEALSDKVERYVFVSTLSVYDSASRLDESTATQVASDPESEDITADYGPLKVLCEREVTRIFPDASLVVRPGLVVGRYDYTGRFAYWPRRVAEGGEVLAPGRPDSRLWLIDGADLADWMVSMIERGMTGVYNAVGPSEPLTMEQLLHACRRVTNSDATFTWADDAFLLRHGVIPYTELPLWVPEIDGGYPFVDSSKAEAAGLTFRPIADTVRDALDWESLDAGGPSSYGLGRTPAGLLARRERALLDDWRAGIAAPERVGLRVAS